MRSRRRARSNPSGGGVLLTLLGLGLAAFSGYELLTGGKGIAGAPAAPPAAPPAGAPAPAARPRPAPPGIRPTAALPAGAPRPPAPPPPAGHPAAAAPAAHQAGLSPQQAVQAGQALVSAAGALFDTASSGGGSAPVFGDGSSPDAPVDIG
jgi:hypothetical protein